MKYDQQQSPGRRDARTGRRPNAGCLFLAAALVLAAAWPDPVRAADVPSHVTPELRAHAIDVLRGALSNNEEFEAKVRAAECLLLLDYSEGVEEAFADDEAVIEKEPFRRIGFWEVRARGVIRPERRRPWIDKIRRIFLDAGADDRVEALRALVGLRYALRPEDGDPFQQAAAGHDGPLAAGACCLLARCGDDKALHRLVGLFASADPATRAAAAWAATYLPTIPPALNRKLVEAARSEPEDSPVRVSLIGAAAVHARGEDGAPLKAELIERLHGDDEAQRYEACGVLAKFCTHDDLAALIPLLDDPGVKVRTAAAYAVLRTERRETSGMGLLDWLVIAAYAVGMLAVGWYFARRTRNTEDYLLGGRKMGSFSLGLSLFATMLSAITCLALPGEVIKNGPIFVLGKISAYPLVALVVGWFLIPFIMQLKITSAYEILETRLGLSVRMLGSFFFLSLRLTWMAVVVFATSDKVLVPLLGLESYWWATPLMCSVLGLVTVAYTSMGGLRAVVLTDVIQTFILFGGAILALVLISVHFGGVSAWWPHGWPDHWPEPKWIYPPGERATFIGALLATFVWFVCTQGSDQMAVQRFLATRDVKAARKTLVCSLVTSALAGVFLTMVGVALMAYFGANPHLMADGQRILGDADKLFPRFIAHALPAGLSGLVMAGLLAAAMSSLSSGVNSSCSVITVDFIDRFRKKKDTESDHVRLAKYISVLIGVVVVLLSTSVGMVSGNLLALSFKICNLLTAPLFGLFFMAMFVRWATVPGTLVGAAVGLAVVVFVNFSEEITGTRMVSFLWAMPLGLLAQVAVGMVASLLPVGRKRSAEP